MGAPRAGQWLAGQRRDWRNWRDWRARWTPPLVDGALAVVVAVATMVSINVATEPGSRPPDAIAYLLGIVMGALLLVRQRWPLAVLLASAATLFIYYSLNYPGVAPAVPLAVALYTAVAAGYLLWGVPISAFFVLTGLFVVVVHRHGEFLLVLTQMVDQAALLAVVVLLGVAIRNRRQYMEEVRERLQQAAMEKEREAERQVAEERLRIARDLHDVMAHTIAAITVQAGLAMDVLDDSPAEARAALGAIRSASREAMTEIRATVGVLRADDGSSAPRAPAPGLDQLDTLFSEARRAGLAVVETVKGNPRQIAAAVGTTAYRIVQESLTNAIRHANASRATVDICYELTALSVTIADNGTGADTMDQQQIGHGLIGMRERASSLGGWLKAGPQPGGGFLVQAWLPTEGAPV